ncbi:unnamed protein product [Commensalibacter communis]|uniref:Uncharacterized protein n=1 Tax=Commensalibacter communis TaxID=2972786 RepID=A0A9W4TRY1_9PROT|nr:hypothetical protein [Commensalibacter communis]CAI3942000.1 unnamed protein product [Commensalibacter communis]CAI3944633.1 unnamed protein product [Commensalibacter communis]CAI3958843.1 unnamed protein product [Commensalibacter communis]CAI3961170.1 unnamed protein product [Commensalibacter communis]
MGKAKRKAQPCYPQIVKEHGLQEQWNSRRYEVVQEQDEESPKRTVERLRRKNFVGELFNRKIITEEQFNYANQYALLCEKALGATQDLYAKVSLMSVNRNQWEPTYSQHEAYEKLFVIWDGMGKFNIKILNMVTLGDMNAKQIGIAISQNRNHILGMIKAVFDSLEHIFNKL